MLKELIKTYLQNRLNAFDKEIEELSEAIIQEEDAAKTKSVIAQSVFEFKPETTRRIRKLKTRISLYLIVFGEIK